MSEYSGRNLKIRRSTDGGSTWTLIANVVSKDLDLSASNIDITTDDSNGWQTSLAEPGVRGIAVNISGIATDEILLDQMLVSTAAFALEDLQVEIDGGTTITADFQFSNYKLSGEKDGATTFESNFISSGEPTKV